MAGRFRTDSPLQFMVVDRTPVPTHRRDANAWAILYLYDLDGRELWRRQMEKGEWCIATRLIQWLGPGQPDCVLVYGFSVERQGPPKPARIYNGQGEVVDELPLAGRAPARRERISTPTATAWRPTSGATAARRSSCSAPAASASMPTPAR